MDIEDEVLQPDLIDDMWDEKPEGLDVDPSESFHDSYQDLELEREPALA